MIGLVLKTNKVKLSKIFLCVVYNHYYDVHKCNNIMLLLITVKIF